MHRYVFQNHRVKELRNKKGFTVRALAKILKYDFSSLSLVENGKMNPGCDFLGKLAGALNVTPNYFFEKVKVETIKEREQIKVGDRVVTPEGPGVVVSESMGRKFEVKIDIKPEGSVTDTLEFWRKELVTVEEADKRMDEAEADSQNRKAK